MQEDTTTPPGPKADERPKALSLAERAEKGEPLTIDELADVTGNAKSVVQTMFLTEELTPSRQFSSLHLAAAQLHGWAAHPMHSADSLRISVEDYRKALKAAEGPPEGARDYVPHAPACSEFTPHDPSELAKRSASQIEERDRLAAENKAAREALAKSRAKTKERS
jgi:hypothetical protein